MLKKMAMKFIDYISSNGWRFLIGMFVFAFAISTLLSLITHAIDDYYEKKEWGEYSAYVDEFKGGYKIVRLGEIITLSDGVYLTFTKSSFDGMHLILVNNGIENGNLLSRRTIKKRWYKYYYGTIVLEEIQIKIRILFLDEKILVYRIEPLTK